MAETQAGRPSALTAKAGDAPHPSAPVVGKLRMRYAKRGRARFSSHRDIARTMEWTLRRAGVPVALSQGFSPHPRLSWIGAAPTGAASEAEYLEIGVTEHLDPALVAREVDAVLPDGLAVIEVVPAGPGALADRIDASRWEIETPGVSDDTLAPAIAAFLAAPEVSVERVTKNGPKPLDVRAAVAELRLSLTRTDEPVDADREDRARAATCGRLTAVVRHTTPAARPDDVCSALRAVAGLEFPEPNRATRWAQGRLDERGELIDPLAADRAAPTA
ncbi:TIGR03936 family radical SAM-associated protein [Actinomycetospora lemnae]|uniref:TIGR03936 family radical SAM-associated protein n=1 Tax=Actinomycetospora lemnae TaxID=3019891 RepID=A0ABT5SX31_9PSEU|nr:TIGR03936 family radical SAM-associated protein [Actinomycetospora sp. DW7H6]MDD7967025.1 TIGR03936 family radical SAM-associated protein [Actinomycetospora sp. DW7H6]